MSDVNLNSGRRTFLLQASALIATAALPGGLVAQSDGALATQSDAALDAPVDMEAIERQAVKIPNRDTLLKFNLDGTRKPFAGNTVICHLPVQCDLRDAMVELHEELASAPFRHKLGLTSTDSYHMTVFPGANDQDRSQSGWPSYVPLDATIESCNRAVQTRMQAARLRCELPLRVRIDVTETLNYFTACTLRMTPVDAEQNANLRALRDQLASVYGFRTNDHDQYTFHITMSYQIARFTDREQTLYRRILRAHLRQMVKAAPVLELGEPEYCVFPDMFRFEPKKLLTCLG